MQTTSQIWVSKEDVAQENIYRSVCSSFTKSIAQ